MFENGEVNLRPPEWTRDHQSGPETTRVDQRPPETTRVDQRTTTIVTIVTKVAAAVVVATGFFGCFRVAVAAAVVATTGTIAVTVSLCIDRKKVFRDVTPPVVSLKGGHN